MAQYTMELRDYIEMWTQFQTGLSWDDKIESGRTHLFDFTYPLYDPDGSYKKDFETHFIKNFYMSEIGFETEGLFKFKLESWLLINMPYFNKLIESEGLTYNPLQNQNVTDSRTKDVTNSNTVDGTSSGNGSTTNSGSLTENNFDRQLMSNTPDERLSITPNSDGSIIDGTNIYANEINEDTQNNSKTSSSNGTTATNETTNVTNNGTTSETVSDTQTGKTGSMTYAEMIMKDRQSYLRIERQIFDEMRKELFMLVY